MIITETNSVSEYFDMISEQDKFYLGSTITTPLDLTSNNVETEKWFKITTPEKSGFFKIYLNHKQNTAHIGQIYVSPEYRRTGIGKYILEYIIDYTRELKYDVLYSDVLVNNIASNIIHRKYMEQTGIIPASRVYESVRYDVYSYSLLIGENMKRFKAPSKMTENLINNINFPLLLEQKEKIVNASQYLNEDLEEVIDGLSNLIDNLQEYNSGEKL